MIAKNRDAHIVRSSIRVPNKTTLNRFFSAADLANSNCIHPSVPVTIEVQPMPEIAEKAQNLFEIKGVLTKFMRMLFPLEFRIDSISNSGPMLPFHYPLLPGDIIYLPERLEPFGTHGDAYIYYFVTTAHLAARHDFGTFKLKLSDIGGFENRGANGVEGNDSFLASFDDPRLAGAPTRLPPARPLH